MTRPRVAADRRSRIIHSLLYADGRAEFISMVASEASEVGGKPTVSHAHVIQAMEV